MSNYSATYANRGGSYTPRVIVGTPRAVLASLRAEGWPSPYVVRELPDNRSEGADNAL